MKYKFSKYNILQVHLQNPSTKFCNWPLIQSLLVCTIKLIKCCCRPTN